MIQQDQELIDLPVAVIINGASLYLPEVRQDLKFAQAVLPSLDAGTSDLYHQSNRPHPELDSQRVLQGLRDFRDEYSGKLGVEIMLVQELKSGKRSRLSGCMCPRI